MADSFLCGYWVQSYKSSRVTGRSTRHKLPNLIHLRPKVVGHITRSVLLTAGEAWFQKETDCWVSWQPSRIVVDLSAEQAMLILKLTLLSTTRSKTRYAAMTIWPLKTTSRSFTLSTFIVIHCNSLFVLLLNNRPTINVHKQQCECVYYGPWLEPSSSQVIVNTTSNDLLQTGILS